MYALGLDQITNAILVGGHKRTILVQGHMGTGKSSMLNILSQKLPKHIPCYLDCTTKDLGDITVPNLAKLDDGTGYVTYLTNEELGAHHDVPVILMIDEYGKANPAVKNALLRLMLERKIGSYTLHPDSIVFATTNLGAEGVGDLLPAHARNRITVVTSRKPTAEEWIEWGINNGIHPTVLGWVRENPQVMQSFEDVFDPEENPHIFHPQVLRAAFVTPRSLEAASDWLHEQASFDDQTLTSLLMGTIGDRGALDLMAFVKLANQLPSLESIKQDPTGATLPTSASAVCMVVYKLLSVLERDWVDSCMTYLNRLDKEAQGLFANGVRAPKYSKRGIVMTNKKFTEWARDNNYMFTADKV
jgi:energy-coupling factor transporter ATP-binding protein EcfA2